MDIQVRKLEKTDAEIFREVRLKGLKDYPEAFGEI